MVISFSNERARTFLFQTRRVYTYRAKKRKRVGGDWLNFKRGGMVQAYVVIEEVGPMPPSQLGPYVEGSGFATLAEWIRAIRDLNKGQLPEAGWLYRVRLVRTQFIKT